MRLSSASRSSRATYPTTRDRPLSALHNVDGQSAEWAARTFGRQRGLDVACVDLNQGKDFDIEALPLD
eukprot:7205-Eustigmatos_ZCMA.PRE.1